MEILSVKNLTKSFGGLMAVSNANIVLNKGELVGLIGPNGAGKTTVFNLLTGVYVPSSGSVEFSTAKGVKKLNGLKPYAITRLGMARTFQNIRLFKDLTVLDNVRIAMHSNIRYGLMTTFLRLPSFFREEMETVQKAERLLEIFNLNSKKAELAKNLPYGEQRRLEIARALATNPSILLLDEPAAGMNPNETAELTDLIQWIRKEFDLTILLIEHDMSLVMKICERLYVLDYGTVIAEGKPEEIKINKRVIEAYLGEEVLDA
ncbi:amino acid/amide ABC transporter ATP-binding protein 1 (HAAT family) [Anaerobacterium chartisolvens]|uniref:Amino acid/amide ABC transporter ATP-binding protein 1 (HAAT family) n=1 Tax=Anaerobacterium chartisolvens TaxID=1297424 RepID=A0A369BC11_9FIRM|nr:ABC transporter ATP-binding protein [Anaerobacterium chartisolvens]RCX17194.1 amino acid/amide ABC transporter ATP-binding protein 1 (HAAT family) [Anaerobacterium chartisolvens]